MIMSGDEEFDLAEGSDEARSNNDKEFDAASEEEDSYEPAVKRARLPRRLKLWPDASVTLCCAFIAVTDQKTECDGIMVCFAKLPDHAPHLEPSPTRICC